MTPTEVTAFLRNYNVWRRGNLDDQPMPDPREIGKAIDAAVEMIDRLEAAESEAIEQARLNGIGSEREAALMAKLEVAERSDAESIAMYRKARDERDNLRIENEALRAEVTHIKEVEFPRKAQAVADGWRGKCERLEAKIAEMEQQEPAKYEFQGRDGKWYPFIDQRHYENTVADGTWPIRALYALPSAQPQLNEIKITLQRALELGQRETWTGARKHRSWGDQREEQQCWNKVWSLLGAQGE